MKSRIKLACSWTGEEEIEAIRQVLRSGILTNGPRTEEFEHKFADRHGARHAVAFANGTVALAAMYLALDIGRGDEVIVPSMTFISSATSVVHVGGTPVFADVDPRTFNLDPSDVQRRITTRTKAVLAVHYAGQPAALDELQLVCDHAGIALLEDAAQAVGARYLGRSVGSYGKMSMFSFTPTKNITMGEGGVVTTNEVEVADYLRLLRNHGQTAQYRHEILGWNWRLTEMQAAMGVVQLDRLDAILRRKLDNARWMTARLQDVPGVTTPWVDPRCLPVFMIYTCLIDRNRDAVLGGMLGAGIEAKLYFPPVHRQPIFEQPNLQLPVTDHLAEHMLSLPMHSLLAQDELEEVADTLEALCESS